MKKKIALAVIIVMIVALIKMSVDHRSTMDFFAAERTENKEAIDLAIEKHGNLNALNGFSFLTYLDCTIETPLTSACLNHDLYAVERLIEKGASVNHVWGDEKSPLLGVTESFGSGKDGDKRGFEILRLLLEKGADPNVAVFKRYPILLLCRSGFIGERDLEAENYLLDAIKLMIEYGAKTDVKYYGRDMIGFLADNNNLTCIKYLIENYEFDINNQDSAGRTPLMEAARSTDECTDTIEYLLSKGADKTLKDNEGNTAYDLAKAYGEEYGIYKNLDLLK